MQGSQNFEHSHVERYFADQITYISAIAACLIETSADELLGEDERKFKQGAESDFQSVLGHASGVKKRFSVAGWENIVSVHVVHN